MFPTNLCANNPPSPVVTYDPLLITKANEMHNFSDLLSNKFEKFVHLFGFYYKNISRCMVLWMSNMIHYFLVFNQIILYKLMVLYNR